MLPIQRLRQPAQTRKRLSSARRKNSRADDRQRVPAASGGKRRWSAGDCLHGGSKKRGERYLRRGHSLPAHQALRDRGLFLSRRASDVGSDQESSGRDAAAVGGPKRSQEIRGGKDRGRRPNRLPRVAPPGERRLRTPGENQPQN